MYELLHILVDMLHDLGRTQIQRYSDREYRISSFDFGFVVKGSIHLYIPHANLFKYEKNMLTFRKERIRLSLYLKKIHSLIGEPIRRGCSG